jgi:tryptophanyl-tRNA synthetase
LAIGLDPRICHIFAHSYITALNQLLLPFLSMVSVAELNRNPTVKDEIRAANRPQVSGMMFTYPVHQAADILFCKGNLVPGGKDQLPHIEVARTIARRFNERFASGSLFFPEPDLLLSDAPLLLGIDGNKMGKSANNAITLGMSESETAALIRKARTDSIREITYDPDDRPEVANLLLLGALCMDSSPHELAATLRTQGSSRLKEVVTDAVNEFFRPIRCLRREYRADPAYLMDVLRLGNEHAESIAEKTLEDVRTMMGMKYY